MVYLQTHVVIYDRIWVHRGLLLSINMKVSMLTKTVKFCHLHLYIMLLLMQTFQESLMAAGAGITLVDSVVIELFKTLRSHFHSQMHFIFIVNSLYCKCI